VLYEGGNSARIGSGHGVAVYNNTLAQFSNFWRVPPIKSGAGCQARQAPRAALRLGHPVRHLARLLWPQTRPCIMLPPTRPFLRALPSRAERALPYGFWLPPQGRVPPKKVAEATSATLSAFYPALAEGQGFISR
jgi:hypothetical protein